MSNSNSVNVSNSQCSLAVCQCFTEKKYKPEKKPAKTGKESKDEQEDRRKKEEQSKNHIYFSVDRPNIHVPSLIWSPPCFFCGKKFNLGKNC